MQAKLALGASAISRSRRPEPLTIKVAPANSGTGWGNARLSISGKRVRGSMGQRRQREMFPAAPSLTGFNVREAAPGLAHHFQEVVKFPVRFS